MENGSKLNNANEMFILTGDSTFSYLTKQVTNDKILAVLPEVKVRKEPARILSLVL